MLLSKVAIILDKAVADWWATPSKKRDCPAYHLRQAIIPINLVCLLWKYQLQVQTYLNRKSKDKCDKLTDDDTLLTYERAQALTVSLQFVHCFDQSGQLVSEYHQDDHQGTYIEPQLFRKVVNPNEDEEYAEKLV